MKDYDDYSNFINDTFQEDKKNMIKQASLSIERSNSREPKFVSAVAATQIHTQRDNSLLDSERE